MRLGCPAEKSINIKCMKKANQQQWGAINNESGCLPPEFYCSVRFC